MALFTGKGDDGSTSFFGCKQRSSKSSELAEALGSVDELNSLLGVVRTVAEPTDVGLEQSVPDILERVQHDLFILQAELADVAHTGDKRISKEKVLWLEHVVESAEKELPPINSFLLSGATTTSGYLDYARAVARRAERRITRLAEKETVADPLKAYSNRLSSLLYALARLTAHKAGKKETPPSYT